MNFFHAGTFVLMNIKEAAFMRALIQNFQDNYLHKLDEVTESLVETFPRANDACICKELK